MLKEGAQEERVEKCKRRKEREKVRKRWCGERGGRWDKQEGLGRRGEEEA